MEVLEVKELTKIYGSGENQVIALDHVSFQVKKGEFVAIVGASGSGKSTLMNLIGGIDRPTSGSVVIDGKKIFDMNESEMAIFRRRNIGIVYQFYNLIPNLTVDENIMLPCLLDQRKPDAGKLERIVEMTGLSNRRKHLPGQLSGGQQQRVALARILAYEPEALLLDEPFSAMDTYLREGLRLELSKVLADYDGVSVMVTHDRDEAFQLCKNIMLLDKGHVLIAGNSRKIFQDPVTCKAARLTGCKNISKIERIGEYRVRALDWDNLEFVTDRPVGDDITAIGIRAHDFEPLAGEKAKTKKEAGEENLIPVVDPSISEMPFEWYITLSNGLWWKKEKTIHTHDAAGVVPEYLRADPSAILLLKGEL